ncbi:MAG: response regulator [Candidatus Margulisbacteria bacterium]|nr:response regulator [Candidatus Margulisiibacteriota bacterium]
MTKILIIDDAAFIRMRVEKFLLRHDFEVFLAEDGQSGIDLFKKELPDVVLLDVTMPGMSGMEVLKQIKEANKDAKVIMLTNVDQQETIMETVKLGAKGFIKKPFEEDKLLDKISKLIKT